MFSLADLLWSCLFVLGFVGVFVTALANLEKFSLKNLSAIFGTGALLLVVAGLWYWCFPHLFAFAIYQVVLPHILTATLLSCGVLALLLLVSQVIAEDSGLSFKRVFSPLTLSYILLAGLLIIGLPEALSGGTYVAINNVAPVKHLEQPVHFSTKAPKYTPHQVAESTIADMAPSGFEVREVSNVPLFGDNAYIAPLVPPRFSLGTQLADISKFVYLRDTADGWTTGSIEQHFRRGPNLWFTKEMYRSAYARNPFRVLDDYRTMQNPDTPEEPKNLVFVIPEITWKFSWGRFIPVWSGDLLVYPEDGHMVYFSADQVKKDLRFRGAPFFPSSLVDDYAGSFNYSGGTSFLDNLRRGAISRLGKIEVAKVGDAELPYFYQTEDGRGVYVEPLEPQGSSKGLAGFYYIDTQTGEAALWQPERLLRGPNASAQAVRTIQNYDWVQTVSSGESSYETGTHDVVETRPLTKLRADGSVDLYWQHSIVPTSHKEVAETVVVSPELAAAEKLRFTDYRLLTAWLEGEDYDALPVAQESTQQPVGDQSFDAADLAKLETQVRTLLQTVEALKTTR